MKTIIIVQLFIIAIILSSCSTGDKKTKNEISSAKAIITKEYYPDGKIKNTSEMSADSILNGLTVFFDSTGTKTGEQYYLNGKLNGAAKSFYNNGKIAEELEYLNDSMVKEKDFNIDGTLLYQNPINIKDIGVMKIKFTNSSHNCFLKNRPDTVEILSENLPAVNKIVFVGNATIRNLGKEKYIITPLNKSRSVKIVLKLRRSKDDKNFIPIDSTEIAIKGIDM